MLELPTRRFSLSLSLQSLNHESLVPIRVVAQKHGFLLASHRSDRRTATPIPYLLILSSSYSSLQALIQKILYWVYPSVDYILLVINITLTPSGIHLTEQAGEAQ